MELGIAREDLLKAVGRTLGIVEKKSTMPILSNVLLEAGEDGVVRVTATDLEVGISDSCEAEVSKAGSVTISAKSLYDVLRNLPPDPVKIVREDGDWVQLSCGAVRFRLVGLPVEDYPAFPALDEVKFIKLEGPQLSAMLDKVHFAISTDETRYSLNGVFIRVVDGHLLMVATDGHRLCKVEQSVDIKAKSGLDRGLILPRKGILELRKLLEDADVQVEMGIRESNCFFRIDDLVLAMRLIDGEFPDYAQVVPASFSKEAWVDRRQLVDSLKRVSVLSYDKAWGLRLEVGKKELVISSSNPNVGEARDVIPVSKYSGDPLAIGFNARYLIDGLAVLPDGEIYLQFNDELLPGVVRHTDDESYLCVVMPMRI